MDRSLNQPHRSRERIDRLHRPELLVGFGWFSLLRGGCLLGIAGQWDRQASHADQRGGDGEPAQRCRVAVVKEPAIVRRRVKHAASLLQNHQQIASFDLGSRRCLDGLDRSGLGGVDGGFHLHRFQDH